MHNLEFETLFCLQSQATEVNSYNRTLLGVNQASRAEARRMFPDSCLILQVCTQWG